MRLFEEEDVRRPYIPWTIFDELRDEKNYQYGDVGSLSRMYSRVWKRVTWEVTRSEPTLDGLCREIDQSRFGDVIAYLAKKKIPAGVLPQAFNWQHTIPKTFYVLLGVHNELQGGTDTLLCGAGASYASFTEAFSKAIGELLERYVFFSSFISKRDNIVKKIFTDKKIPRALLYESPRFFEWQRKYIPQGLTSEILKRNEILKEHIRCVKGVSLHTGEKVYIPLQYIEWGPKYIRGKHNADRYIFSPRTTNGAGGGFTLTDATVSGLCELVERDGFMIHWLNRLSPRRIRIEKNDPAAFSQHFLDVYWSLSDRGHEVYFLDITTDVHVPSIACVILKPLSGGRKSISVTGKCSPDPSKAVELALLEHMAFLSSSTEEETARPMSTKYVPFADGEMGRKERMQIWRGGGMTDKITFFLSGKEISFRKWAEEFVPVPTDKKSMLLHVLGEFSRMEKEFGPGYEVFRYESRHKILEELEYHVVKVIVPALVPLYLVENSALLDSARLREVPKKLGYAAAPVDGYNPLPHPFP